MKGPQHAITIRNYAEFREDVRVFALAKYNCMLIIANSSLGKTETVKSVVGEESCATISGCPSAFRFFTWAHDNRDRFLILDDVAPLFYKDYDSNSLLKNLTETVPEKTLRWARSSVGENRQYPSEFQTTSRVIIICNSWQACRKTCGPWRNGR